jgi:hypothetical protein
MINNFDAKDYSKKCLRGIHACISCIFLNVCEPRITFDPCQGRLKSQTKTMLEKSREIYGFMSWTQSGSNEVHGQTAEAHLIKTFSASYRTRKFISACKPPVAIILNHRNPKNYWDPGFVNRLEFKILENTMLRKLNVSVLLLYDAGCPVIWASSF